MQNRQAFTLIELLVVVLIIGILAATALPLYQRAVHKARATEALLNLKKIAEAQTAYFLANGQSTQDLSKLDIDIKEGFYTYHCNNLPELVTGDCYAVPLKEGFPVFERTYSHLYCRGTEQQCKPFSTTLMPSNEGLYWIIESF